ncbi:MAG: DUF4330 family protein [Clostridia bacterium]|nr:DUF4330 family protein [Clostridia bacterium]
MDKPKFNILDGLIILLLILVIAAGVFFLKGANSGASGGAETKTAVFKIQLTKVEESLYDKFLAALENEETVWIGVKERFEGKIEEIEFGPAAKVSTDLYTGTAVLAEDPTSSDITITVRSEAVETKDAISASGTAIRVGEETAIRGKEVAGYGFIIDLKTVNE